MGTDQKHTPTPEEFCLPLKADGRNIIATFVSEGWNKSIPANKEEVVIATCNSVDQAAFIVRAVNAHEELLEMLYAVLPSVEEADEFNKPAHKLGPKVKALIAKAEGK